MQSLCNNNVLGIVVNGARRGEPKQASHLGGDIGESGRGSGDPRNIVHVNMHLIEAGSPEQAYEKALALGRGSEPAKESVLTIVADVAARMGVYRPVRVVMSTRVDGPSVLGWLRPLILLTPATALGLTTPIDPVAA